MQLDDMPDLVLRPFRPSDADVVVTWLGSRADAIAMAGSAAPWPYRAADLAAASAVDGCRALTVTSADHPDTVLGHVAVVTVTATAGRLARVVLAPYLRGRGLSGTLLRLAVAEARALGLRELTLFVVPGNTAALRAYASAGFRTAAVDPEHPEYARVTRSL